MSADYVMLCGWNRPVTGREKVAAELFTESIGFWTKKKEAGQIASFQPVFLTPHGGDFNGFILVQGDAEKLDTIRRSNEWIDFSIRAGQVLDGWGAITGWTGQALMDVMARWVKAIR